MAGITIRSLGDELRRRLRARAAEHGRSMEKKVREFFRLALVGEAPPRNLASAIRARVALLGGVDLELTTRGPMRETPHVE